MENTQKFTPGPWRIGDAGHTVFGPPTDKPSPKTIATMPKIKAPCKSVELDENIANAQLIAAAPELLEAAKRAEKTLLKLLKDGNHDGVLRDLNAAISKAEGKQ